MPNFKSFTIYSIGFFSLLLGLVLNENSSGGAKIDFNILFPFVEGFSYDFQKGLNSYIGNSASIIHSPVFYILISFIYKLIDNVIIIKIFYIFLCSFLPLIFYLILKDKFKLNERILFIFSLIIFLSPYFRSSAIWLLGDNLSLIFFSLSIYYFNKFNEFNNNNLREPFFCLFFLILCCYIRYYYCLFSLYYLFFFYQKLNRKYFLILLLISIIFSIPALFYFYHIFSNANFATTVINYSQVNFYSNSLVILSILLFYLIPFCFLQRILFIKYMRENKKFILIIFIIFFISYLIGQYIFNHLINFSSNGGGVFMKLSSFYNINELLFLSFASFVSLVILDYFFKEKRLQNYVLLVILIFSFPIFTIYQKYFDPLFFLFFFGLIRSSELKNIFLESKIFLPFIFLYFSFFLIFSLIYYSEGFN
tara:strand:+ start:222 stop:1487 length:1266 start_codon:yes stop_codon:yes gene_type:complete